MDFIGFTIPIFKTFVPNWSKYKDEIISEVEFEKFGTNYTDYQKNLDNPPKYKDKFFKIIEPSLYQFGSTICNRFQVKSLWCQKYSNGEYHGAHNHGPTGFSAIFYAQLHEDHTATTFISPVHDYVNGNSVDITPKVSEGDIIFFPSLILHYSNPVFGEKERIIFSFNIDVLPDPIFKLD
jgi:hypothetical protein